MIIPRIRRLYSTSTRRCYGVHPPRHRLARSLTDADTNDIQLSCISLYFAVAAGNDVTLIPLDPPPLNPSSPVHDSRPFFVRDGRREGLLTATASARAAAGRFPGTTGRKILHLRAIVCCRVGTSPDSCSHSYGAHLRVGGRLSLYEAGGCGVGGTRGTGDPSTLVHRGRVPPTISPKM